MTLPAFNAAGDGEHFRMEGHVSGLDLRPAVRDCLGNIVGQANARPWRGHDPYTVMCVACTIDCVPTELTSREDEGWRKWGPPFGWEVSISFHAPAGWRWWEFGKRWHIVGRPIYETTDFNMLPEELQLVWKEQRK